MKTVSMPRFGAREFAYGAVALLVIAILAFAIGRPIQVLPRITVSPAFILTDQRGARLTSEDLRGQLVLYTFAYQDCETPCESIHAVMQALQTQYATATTQDVPLHLVTVLFDPLDDSATDATLFAEQIGADPTVWSLLRGATDQIRQVIGGGFGVYYAEAEDEPSHYKFDPVFVLVDGAGIIRARYRTAVPSLEILQRDIDLILTEARQSEGAMRLAYEAAHLFLCYPP